METPSDLSKRFDAHITTLIEVIKDLHDKRYGSMNDNLQTWMLYTGKFHLAYLRSKNPLGWTGVFTEFYVNNKANFNEPIFITRDGSTVCNDKWLRTAVGPKATGIDALKPKGLTLYFDPSIHAISIPIQEAYTCAHAYAKDKASNVKAQLYPLSIIYNLYALVALVIPEPSAVLVKSVNILKNYVEDITPSENADVGKGMDGLNGIINSVMKQTGINIPGLNPDAIADTMKSAFSGPMMKTIGDVVNKASAAMGPAMKDGDPKAVLNSLSDMLKTSDMQDLMIAGTQAAADQVTGGAPAAAASAPEVVDTSSNPEEQE